MGQRGEQTVDLSAGNAPAFRLPARLWARAVTMWLGLLLAGFGLAFAGQDLQSVERTEARAAALSAQLRCLACENTTAANATAADPGVAPSVDLHNEVRSLVHKGRTDSEVVEAMIARYGNFVRYGPAADHGDSLVWAFMLLAALIGATAGVWVMQRNRRDSPIAGANGEEIRS